MSTSVQHSLPAPVEGRITHLSLSATVYQTVREWLSGGELLPGQKLTGRVLAERLGVSQTPVREAMLQLVAERALNMNPNRSVTVPMLDREKFIELRDMRVALEGLAARCAVQRCVETGLGAEQIGAIAVLHRQMMAAKKRRDYRTTLRLNRAIHFSVYELSGRHELVATIQSLWARTGPYLNFLYEKAGPAANGAHPHESLLDALTQGDPDMAEAAIRHDILDGGRAILDALPSAEEG
ncbi:FCD domain-containing protein [Pusillimonas sp. TS35]|uniref:GntR family transcriptional regulator n=1 Tax=Paracandidimonas lactea TaxID=2895524 RepID=UPI0013682563|nr:GntR family transcriptional regulator [Paracandidimonas lactea]MYN13920.1 FCD domain-containing protein [Pusillimonas sp. TS35]